MQSLSRLTIALVAVTLFAGIIAGFFAFNAGKSSGSDLAEARRGGERAGIEDGVAAGHEQGSTEGQKVGDAEGYKAAYKVTFQKANKVAYDKAFKIAKQETATRIAAERAAEQAAASGPQAAAARCAAQGYMDDGCYDQNGPVGADGNPFQPTPECLMTPGCYE